MSNWPVRVALRWVLVILAAGAVVAIWPLMQQADPKRSALPPEKIVIALPTQISAGALLVAADQQLFAKHRLAVTIQPFALGKQALDATLQGKADLALVADTPFVLAILKGARITTVGTIFGSRNTMAIVARKDRGITVAADLKNKTIGTIFGTNAQFFVDTLLVANGIAQGATRVVDLKPEAIAGALENGTVDAVTTWHPDLARIEQKMGDRVITIRAEELFVYRFILVGRQDWIAQHPEAVQRVLAAVEDGTQFVHTQEDEAKVIIAQSIGLAPALMARSFNPNDFQLSLDQSLLLALGDQTRWAIKRGLTSNGDVPNYLDNISQQPLAAVIPSAVKIIR